VCQTTPRRPVWYNSEPTDLGFNRVGRRRFFSNALTLCCRLFLSGANDFDLLQAGSNVDPITRKSSVTVEFASAVNSVRAGVAIRRAFAEVASSFSATGRPSEKAHLLHPSGTVKEQIEGKLQVSLTPLGTGDTDDTETRRMLSATVSS
jgi:hypothetical protein